MLNIRRNGKKVDQGVVVGAPSIGEEKDLWAATKEFVN